MSGESSIGIGACYEARFSTDGKRLVVVGRREVVVWDPWAGELLGRARFADVASVDFAPDGERLVLKEWDGTVLIVDVPALGVITRFVGSREGTPIRFAPDGHHLVQGTWSGTLTVRDSESGELTWAEAGSPIMGITSTRDRARWAYNRVGGLDAHVAVRSWPFADNTPQTVANVPASTVALSDNGQRLATSGGGRSLHVLERPAGAPDWTPLGRIDEMPVSGTHQTLTWLDGGTQLLYASGRRIILFEPSLREVALGRMSTHVFDVALDPSETLIAFGLGNDSEGTVSPWPPSELGLRS